MGDQMRSKFWVILETIMLLAWIVTTIIFLIGLFTTGTQCKANPLVYGAKVLSDKNNASFSCECSFDNEPNYIIYVDKEHWVLNSSKLVFDSTNYKLNFTG